MDSKLHTNFGNLRLELFCSSVPKTTYNFLALCASGRYNQTLFHRSIRGFMIQGGSPDPSGKGKGGASIWGGNFEDEIRPTLRHNARGIVSMANKGSGTNACQFFITFAKHPHLDGKNTVFGKIVGEEADITLDRMEAVKTDADEDEDKDGKDRSKKYRPREAIRIEGVTIHANPLADDQDM